MLQYLCPGEAIMLQCLSLRDNERSLRKKVPKTSYNDINQLRKLHLQNVVIKAGNMADEAICLIPYKTKLPWIRLMRHGMTLGMTPDQLLVTK